MTRALLVAVAAIAAVSLAVPSAAEPYGARVIGVPKGATIPSVWDYQIVNVSSDADYSIRLIQIDVDEDTFVIGASAPPGWTAYFEQNNPDHFLMWTCGSAGLQASDDLSGFNAVFTQRPTYQGWSAQFSWVQDPDASLSQSGEVVIIEPGAAAGLLTGLMCATAFAIRRRKK